MSATVQRLLKSFEALSAEEKHEATMEILRRFAGAAEGDLPEATLVELADELFRTLDAEESANAPS